MTTDAPTKTLPPLENGDRLTCDEFWRIFRERHDIKKAEHLEGIVYVPSPVSPDSHGHPHTMLATWIGLYAGPRGILAPDNSSVLLPNRQTIQPDLFLLAPDSAAIHHSDHLEGVPELVIEIAASSASYDLHVKKGIFEQAGVREYVVWRTYDRAVDWFRLADGAYQRVEPADGRIESSVFAGLVLDVEALLKGDYATVFGRITPPAPAPGTSEDATGSA